MSYLVVFAQIHPSFRLAELHSLATLQGVHLDIPLESYDPESPFLTIHLPSDSVAKAIASRAILIKGIFELWGVASSTDDLVSSVKNNIPKYLIDLDARSKPFRFRFVVTAFGKKLGLSYMQSLMGRFAFLPLTNGVVNLKGENLDVEIHIVEDYRGNWKTSPLRRIFLLRLVTSGARDTVFQYSLKDRNYLGTTSMDAELALLMANQALAKKGDIILDPFAGTGSVLVPCAHFGAYTLGSDIDPRIIRGTGKVVCNNAEGSNLYSNFVQYNKAHQVDIAIADNARSPWWRNGKPYLDAIVTDPPYGIRESAKQLASEDNSASLLPSPSQYVPRKVAYSMDDILTDLVLLAAKCLVVGGRLVYWLATSKRFTVEDIPLHPSLKLICHSEQAFGRWSRWLITMEKTAAFEEHYKVTIPTVEKGGIPSYRNFRDHYFSSS